MGFLKDFLQRRGFQPGPVPSERSPGTPGWPEVWPPPSARSSRTPVSPVADTGAPVGPGDAARGLLAQAKTLRERAADVAAAPAAARRGAVRLLAEAKRSKADAELAQMDIAGLQPIAKGIRTAALDRAGYKTVASVLAAPRWQLERHEGVGEKTARDAQNAARQVRDALAESVRVRPDPDRRSAEDTALLQAVHALDHAERAVGPIESRLGEVVAELDRLLPLAGLAQNRLKWFFAGGRRDDARAALGALQALVSSPSTQELRTELDRAAIALAAPKPGGDEIWRDFQARAGDYYSLLEELAGTPPDLAAARGFIPTEIVERIEQVSLDRSLLDVSLRGYQAFGAKFALVQGRAILGDEMGLGKTIEALAAIGHLAALGERHFLVVAPASVLVNWCHEVERRTRLLPRRIYGPAKDRAFDAWRRDGGIAVTTFETLRALPPPSELRLSMLVVDEAHYVKNPQTKRAQAVAGWTTQAERVLFLTGTPMENRVEEFRNLVRYLQPDVAQLVSAVDGLAGADRFRKAVAPAYLRRNQADVLDELPDLLEVDEWVDLTPHDLEHYRSAVASENFMAMRRAPFLAGDPRCSAKLERLVDIVAESAANEWKVVVFSYFRDVLDIVHGLVGTDGLTPITGSVAPAERQRLVDEFTSVDGHAVLVSQIEAGGTGLNIQAGSVVILTEPQWKPSIEWQAIARCHRMGQTRRVHVHRLLAEDGVDRRMVDVLGEKRRLFEAYARRSEAKEATAEAVDVSEVEFAVQAAERQIIEAERRRLGLEPDTPAMAEEGA